MTESIESKLKGKIYHVLVLLRVLRRISLASLLVYVWLIRSYTNRIQKWSQLVHLKDERYKNTVWQKIFASFFFFRFFFAILTVFSTIRKKSDLVLSLLSSQKDDVARKFPKKCSMHKSHVYNFVDVIYFKCQTLSHSETKRWNYK